MVRRGEAKEEMMQRLLEKVRLLGDVKRLAR
jgi:hypothetical protein